MVAAGESLDQGWVITRKCGGIVIVEPQAVQDDQPVVGRTIQDQLENQTWKLYPNPASGYLRIEIRGDKIFNYRLYDALGRSVKSGVYQRGQTIDIQGLTAGVYHLQLHDKDLLLGTEKVLLME